MFVGSFKQWQEKHYGEDDSKPLFERLQAEVNKNRMEKLSSRWYESQTEIVSGDEKSDGKPIHPHTRKGREN